METTSTRLCGHCEEPIPDSLRSDARYCNSTCRAKHARAGKAKPEGTRWIRGHWRTPRKPPGVRRRRIPVWETVSPVVAALAVIGAHRRSEAAA